LTILGSSTSVPRSRRACSSYLVETAGAAIVADLGTGALANLLSLRAADSLDAIVVSHMHADHFLDLVPLRYALAYGTRANERRLPVYLPGDGRDLFRRLVAAFEHEEGRDFLAEFDVRGYGPGDVLRIGAMTVRFAPVRHFIPGCAMRFETGGASLVFSGDTAPCEPVAALAANASVLLCEASLATGTEEEPRGHLTAREAGELAHGASAGRLVITHYGTEADPVVLAGDARAAGYAGPIDVADDLDRFVVG